MQGTRTVDNPEGEEEVLVKTEFVWADGAEKDVKLAGSWNGWMPIQMYHEGGMVILLSWVSHLPAFGRGGKEQSLAWKSGEIDEFIDFLCLVDGNAGGMWSVVTPVPSGTHEFKFIVDGEWKHSTRHPTVGDDEENMNNIRVIRGPPQAYVQQQQAAAEDNQPRKKRGCCTIS